MDGEKIYWDSFLRARVTVHQCSPEGITVTLLDDSPETIVRPVRAHGGMGGDPGVAKMR